MNQIVSEHRTSLWGIVSALALGAACNFSGKVDLGGLGGAGGAQPPAAEGGSGGQATGGAAPAGGQAGAGGQGTGGSQGCISIACVYRVEVRLEIPSAGLAGGRLRFCHNSVCYQERYLPPLGELPPNLESRPLYPGLDASISGFSISTDEGGRPTVSTQWSDYYPSADGDVFQLELRNAAGDVVAARAERVAWVNPEPAGGCGSCEQPELTQVTPQAIEASCDAPSRSDGPYPVALRLFNPNAGSVWIWSEGCFLDLDLTSCRDGFTTPLAFNTFCTTECSSSSPCLNCGVCAGPMGIEIPAQSYHDLSWTGLTYTVGTAPDGCTCHTSQAAPAGRYRLSVPVWNGDPGSPRSEPDFTMQREFVLDREGVLVLDLVE